MNTLRGLLLTAALACAGSTSAWAYHFSPPYVSAKLHGKLTFTPNEGSNTKPFTCAVTFDLRTKTGEIKAVKFPSGNCQDITFQNLPWYSDITSANSGHSTFSGFSSGDGNCEAETTQWQVNASGIFTLPAGQCLSGTLTSHPPVTIVP